MCIDIYDQFSLSSRKFPIRGGPPGTCTGDFMTRTRTALMLLAVVTATVTAGGQQGEKQWPPRFNPANSEASVLSPEDEMKTFVVPPGYGVELVVSEPLVQDPILIDWDSRGRMWAIELLGYMPDLKGT